MYHCAARWCIIVPHGETMSDTIITTLCQCPICGQLATREEDQGKVRVLCGSQECASNGGSNAMALELVNPLNQMPHLIARIDHLARDTRLVIAASTAEFVRDIGNITTGFTIDVQPNEMAKATVKVNLGILLAKVQLHCIDVQFDTDAVLAKLEAMAEGKEVAYADIEFISAAIRNAQAMYNHFVAVPTDTSPESATKQLHRAMVDFLLLLSAFDGVYKQTDSGASKRKVPKEWSEFGFIEKAKATMFDIALRFPWVLEGTNMTVAMFETPEAAASAGALISGQVNDVTAAVVNTGVQS